MDWGIGNPEQLNPNYIETIKFWWKILDYEDKYWILVIAWESWLHMRPSKALLKGIDEIFWPSKIKISIKVWDTITHINEELELYELCLIGGIEFEILVTKEISMSQINDIIKIIDKINEAALVWEEKDKRKATRIASSSLINNFSQNHS